jgi:hypothetical protein
MKRVECFEYREKEKGKDDMLNPISLVTSIWPPFEMQKGCSVGIARTEDGNPSLFDIAFELSRSISTGIMKKSRRGQISVPLRSVVLNFALRNIRT